MIETAEYAEMKLLLQDKRVLQCWLRQVDRRLREIEILSPGSGKVAKLSSDELHCDPGACVKRLSHFCPLVKTAKDLSVSILNKLHTTSE